ncbi:MAG: hypothetical protein QOK07_3084 [Gemmatimonadaceae bacterium]|jgi:hypothetical protein|nr:hypothetical protein [Gemmatimonadaceae bacterium]
MKLTNHRNAVLAVATFAMFTAVGRTAEAQLGQLHPSFYGSAEVDTRHTQFYLLGMYLGMGGLGWSPYFNINAYTLHYRLRNVAVNPDRTLTAISPTIGMAYAARTGGVSFGVGYAWVHNPNPGALGAEGGGSNGVTASFGAYHNGTGRRAMHTQLLSNYNFGSRYFWGRLRGSVPLGYSVAHPTRVGLEFVGQGGGKNGNTSNSFQVGPTLEYAWTPNFRTTGVVGYKSIGGGSFPSRESAAYFKLEFSFSP